MKTTSLLLAAAVSLASSNAFAQPVVARGQVQLINSHCTTALSKPMLVPIDQAARAGNAGTVLFYSDSSRASLSPGSEFVIYGGISVMPVFEAPLDYPDATSAIKSIDTRRITQRFRNEAVQTVAHDGLFLRSGRLLVDRRASAIDVRVLNATLSGADARFSVTRVSPCSARVSVIDGVVTVSLPGEASRELRCGEFMMLSNDACGRTVACNPRLISESALAKADRADLVAGLASRLAPVGECVDLAGDLDPVCELVGAAPCGLVGVPSVGTGPSVPFDLANRILTEANEANVSGQVQSPEAP